MDESTYLKYLPRVLWEEGPTAPSFSLGGWLRVFEKLLSGIDDGVSIVRGNRTYAALERTIARLPRLFDAWTTPPEFLDWLAQWLALELEQQWSEYQKREILSRIVSMYSRRGTRGG